MLSLIANGYEFKNWDDAFAEHFIEAACSTFGFSSTVKSGDLLNIHEGDEVQILADGKKVIHGYVDSYDSDYDAKTHSITIKGRSKTQDFVDSNVPYIKEWIDYSLYDLISEIAGNFNISVQDEAEVTEILHNIIGAELGDTCFDFVEKFCRRRQVLLTDNADGDLVITKPSTELFPYALRNIKGDKANNIKAASRSIDLSELFGIYVANVQGYPLNVDDFENYNELIQSADQFIDSEIRSTRYFEFYAEETITIDTIDSVTDLKKRAQWEGAIRRARNFKYSATVQGHSLNDVLFKDNMLYQIDDEMSNISGQYFCNKIRYEYGLTSGSVTKLNFSTKNSYTLQAEKDKILLTDD